MKNILKNLNDWSEFVPVKSSIPAAWSEEDLVFEWHENVQTNEVPKDDPWDTAPFRYYMEDMYRAWGVDDLCTKHYLSFRPTLTGKLSTILDNFKFKTISHNLLKLPPGRVLLWHFDAYATFIKHNNLLLDDFNRIGRTVVMMNDWKFGQVIQIGNEVISHWSQGDTFSWPNSTWHGASNFGGSDLVVMQVSYLNE